MHSLRLLLPALSALWLLQAVGCGDDSNSGGSSTGGSSSGGNSSSSSSGGSSTGGSGGGGGGGSEPVSWTACTLGELAAECTTLAQPLQRDGASDATVDFHVKRVLASQPPSQGQLWLLQGGPGLAGSTLAGLVPLVQTIAPNLDIYLPDHRGVGESSPLLCDGFDTPISGAASPPSEAAVAAVGSACVDQLLATWGSIEGFSSVEAAADLGETIERTRDGDEPVFLWAVSYGTRWALRYLQQYPEQASGVVLDSLESESLSFTDFGAQLETAAQPLLALCGADPFCSGRLGADPAAFVDALMAKLAAGHCPTSANLTQGDHRLLFTKTMTLPTALRNALPALLFRVDRCNAQDQEAILSLRALFAASEAELGPSASGVLNVHVALSELYNETPASFDSLLASDASRAFSNGDAGFYRGLYDSWPRYDASPYRGQYPTTDVPVLMLQGTLDPLTPPQHAEEVAAALSAPGQTLVLLEGGAHGSLFQSQTMSGSDCGAELMTAFLGAPSAAIDASCASDLVQPTFDDDGLSFLFGTSLLWD